MRLRNQPVASRAIVQQYEVEIGVQLRERRGGRGGFEDDAAVV